MEIDVVVANAAQWRLCILSGERQQFLAQVLTCRLHRRSDTGDGHRTARHGSARHGRIAQLETDTLHGNTKRLRGNLRHDGISPRAEILRSRLNEHRPVRHHASQRRRGHAVSGKGCGGHAPTDQRSSVTHRAGFGIAAAPTEALRSLLVALAQALARPRFAALWFGIGVIFEPQRDGIHAQRVRQFVHRRFDRKGSGSLARRALERRHTHSERGESMVGVGVRTRIERPRRRGGAFDIVFHFGGMRYDGVSKRSELPVAASRENHVLIGLRSSADRPEHLRSRENDLHRPS